MTILFESMKPLIFILFGDEVTCVKLDEMWFTCLTNSLIELTVFTDATYRSTFFKWQARKFSCLPVHEIIWGGFLTDAI